MMNPKDRTYAISAATLSAWHKEATALSSVILSNPILPILDNFLLKIEKGELVLAASDQQTSIISRLPLEGAGSAEPLHIAVPARMLKETLKNLPQQPVSLEVDRERYNIALKTSHGHYKIACENADDFPDVFSFSQGEVDVTLPAGVLHKAIKQTIFAASKDELRPEIAGVFISLDSEGLGFTATDGHRLVSYKRQDITSKQTIACIVPSKALQLLSQLLTGQADQSVKLTFRDKQLLVNWDHIQVIISLVNETYPDYENVIPRNNPHRLTFNTTYLPTLKRISLYANRSTHQLRLHLQKNEVKAIAEDLDFSNEAHETIPCQYEGPDMEIGFNAKMLTEMLGVFPPQEDVQLALDTPNKAVLIAPANHVPQEEVRMLIMPLSLKA